MALVSQIVNRSLRLLGVLDVAAAPAAVDSQTAISVLNALCSRWEANGLALGWANVSAPDDTLPAPEEAHEALAYNLAVKLAPEYGNVSNLQVIEQQARDSLAELRRDRLVEMPLSLSSDLPSGLRGYYDIYTDEFV